MDRGRTNPEYISTSTVPSISYLIERAKLSRIIHTKPVFADGLTYTIARPPNVAEYSTDASTETGNTGDNDFGEASTSMEVDPQDKFDSMEEALKSINLKPIPIPATGSLELDDQVDSLGADGFNGFEYIFPRLRKDKDIINRRLDGVRSAPSLMIPTSQETFLPTFLCIPKPAFDTSFMSQINQTGNQSYAMKHNSSLAVPSLPRFWEPQEVNGRRRSAFLSYEIYSNLQKGNGPFNEIQSLIHRENSSIYEKAGRGELTAEDLLNVRDINEPDSEGLTLMMWSAAYGKQSTIQLLINAGATVDKKGNNQETALHLAAVGGHDDAIKVLISNGARIHAVDKFGNTPLHYAVYENHPEATTALLEGGANVFQLNNRGVKVYDLAISRKDTWIAIDNFLSVAVPNENTRG